MGEVNEFYYAMFVLFQNINKFQNYLQELKKDLIKVNDELLKNMKRETENQGGK